MKSDAYVNEFDSYDEFTQEYTCQDCGLKFEAYKYQVPLAYCDTCADKIESGLDY